MGRLRPPFFWLAVGAIRKDARGVAVAVAAAETVSEAACLSRFALWYAIITAGHKPDSAPRILHWRDKIPVSLAPALRARGTHSSLIP